MVAKGGLEDVVAATSAICYLDGERGVLSYQGIDVHDLARASTFEETCFLLWHGRLPDRQELGDLESRLAAARELPEPLLRLIRTLPPADGMEALRTLTSALVHYEGEGEAGTHPGYRRAVHLTGRVGSIVATYGRMSAGGGPVRPDPAMTHAASFLYLLTGDRPSTVAARALDVALILHADHELNASTFAARVTAATLADLDSAIVSAISTLKGPLHGGANAEVMRMLMAIGPDANQDRVEEIVGARLARKEKIPGFGHRVYRTEDPRATHLRGLSREVGARAGDTRWFDLSQRIEVAVKREKPLHPNVDFYSASTYYSLGIPIELFTPVFAVSRIAGWTAHVLEQYANNRLIRPRAEYVGPAYPQRYVPLDQR